MYWVCGASHGVEGGEWSQSIQIFVHTLKPWSWEMEPIPKSTFLIGPSSPTHDVWYYIPLSMICHHLIFVAWMSRIIFRSSMLGVLLVPLPAFCTGGGVYDIHLFPPNLNPSKIPTLNQTSISLEPHLLIKPQPLLNPNSQPNLNLLKIPTLNLSSISFQLQLCQ